MIHLLPEWVEFLSVLRRRGVRYLIVGGHALAAHGRPRFTEDLDVLIDPTAANARKVGAAIADFGFDEIGRDWRWFSRPYRITMLGRVPYRIDLLTSISGVSFRAAWRGRSAIETEVGAIPVLGLNELRINKAAAGRTKDLLDLALLAELERASTSPRKRSRRAPRKRTFRLVKLKK